MNTSSKRDIRVNHLYFPLPIAELYKKYAAQKILNSGSTIKCQTLISEKKSSSQSTLRGFLVMTVHLRLYINPQEYRT